MRRKKFWNRVIFLFLLAISCLFVMPIFYCVFTSLKTSREILQEVSFFPRKITLDNYRYVFERGAKYLNYYWNSIVITFVSVLSTALLASLSGYAFAKLPFKGSNTLLNIILFVLTFPLAALLIPIYIMEYKTGLLNSHLGLILPNIMCVLPFSIFIMRSTFIGLPDGLVEAAEIDGCSVFDTWWRIMLPLAKNGLETVIVSAFYNVWGEFTLAKTLATRESAMPITVALTLLKGEDWNYGVLGAAITLSIIPPITVFLIFQKEIVAGLTIGAEKG